MRFIFWSLLMLASASASAADWNGRKFPDWSQDTVLRLLTDSPWSRPRTVHLEWLSREDRLTTYKNIPGADHSWPNTGGSPVGGIGGKASSLPDRADILVRWASALPVRQATALYKQRDEKLQAVSINELIAPASSDYIVELFGIPAEIGHRGAGSVEAIAQASATLKLQTGRVLKPNRVEAILHARTMELRVHFPRTEIIELSDRELEFSVDIQIFSVKERFRLTPMRYQGNLEL
ncbi:MAG: hypothetical protein NTY38_18665 [Acidobacteria bacterium]|nr:hypothetical protein [Acidobacteriota bacterium]